MASLLASLPRPRRGGSERRRLLPVGWLAAAAGAAVTSAGLAGLALAVVVVQTLDPAGGLPVGGSAALAGRLWLLAQGAPIGLPSGPVTLAPLLLTLGIAWGLARAGRTVVRARDLTGGGAVLGAAGVIAAVHTLLSVLLAAVLDSRDVRVSVLGALAGSAALAAGAVGWGVARESGLLDAALGRLPGAVRPLLRGALAGLLAALALCTAAVAVGVAADASGYARLSGSLGGAGAGALGLLGLSVLLLPNAAAATLGLAAGPGFAVGTGTVISVSGVTLGPVPALPLLAALPDTQAVPLLAFVAQAVPALAGLVAGRTLGRWLGPEDGGSLLAGLWGLAAGALLGLASGALVWVAGGSLGDGALAEVGAPPLATALAVAAQSGIAAALAAAVARWRARA